MAKRATAKTPTVAIARVLRDLGLKQGSDFRVRGQYTNGERVGTFVAALSAKADQVIADNADQIEYRVQQDGGFAFREAGDPGCSDGSRCVHVIVSGGDDGQRPVAHAIVDLMRRRVVHPFYGPDNPGPLTQAHP